MLSDKVKVKDPIALRPRAQCDEMADECLGNPQLSPLKENNSFVVYLSHNIGRSIFNGRHNLRKSSLAYLISTRWNFQTQSFMRSVVVIFETPLIKLLLRLLISPSKRLAQQFGFQSLMKPFVFPQSFRMSRKAIASQNTKPYQPDRKLGKRAVPRISPRRTIISDYLIRQTILAKCVDQTILNRFGSFVQTRLQYHRVTRMIIQNSQRVTTTLRASNMPLEIHLPQIIRMFSFKSLKSDRLLGFKFINQSMTPKNLSYCARGWNIVVPEILQSSPDLPTTPNWMLTTNLQHCFFYRLTDLSRTIYWAPRAIDKAFFPLSRITVNPFVPSFTADSEPFAQRTDVSAVSRKFNKFFSERSR
jgi:hypothetical protein